MTYINKKTLERKVAIIYLLFISCELIIENFASHYSNKFNPIYLNKKTKIDLSVSKPLNIFPGAKLDANF